MSARERAHPWWVEPLPPYDPGWGDGSVTVKLKLPVCSACGRGIHEHHAYYTRDWMSPLLCPALYATLYGQEWTP